MRYNSGMELQRRWNLLFRMVFQQMDSQQYIKFCNYGKCISEECYVLLGIDLSEGRAFMYSHMIRFSALY